jgi:hypothetical protein
MCARAVLMSAGVVLFGAVFASGAALAQTSDTADFGAPPSGEIPIIFNDRHVYTKPDKLRESRVLSALVRNGTILIPLRSMFEQTGATVSYDPGTKTVHLSKTGADVVVTVGKPIVTINGDDRPLDVPPEIHNGVVLVPVRVLSEGMGAYVQWLPDRRVVVIRYLTIAPTPAPAPPPTAPPPTPVPTAAPTAPPPAPAPTQKYEVFVAGDYDFSPIVYNEVSPGNTGNSSFTVKGGFEFPIFGERWMLEANWFHDAYPHNSFGGVAGCVPGTAGCSTVDGTDPFYQPGICPAPDPGCVTVIGYHNTVAFNGLGQAYVPGFGAQEDDVDFRLGFKIADPRIYVGVGGYYKHYNYLGHPTLLGAGVGLEKLPDLDRQFSLYGSLWYYPNISGRYTYPTSIFLLGPGGVGGLSGQTINLAYSALKYNVGGTVDLFTTPLYLDFGYGGERFHGISNAPGDTSVAAPYAGLGLHF